MMKFFKNKFSKIVLYIITLTVLIMVLSGILIWHYSTNIIEDYQREMVNNFQQNVLKNVDKNYNQMLKATMQIFDDSCIRDFLMFEKYDEEQIAAAQTNYRNYIFYFDLESIHIINKRTDSVWNNTTVVREQYSTYKEVDKLEKILEVFEKGYNFINGEKLEIDDGLYYIYENFQGYTFVLNMKSDKYEKDILKYLSPFKCNTWIYYRDMISFTDSEEITDVVSEYKIDTQGFDGSEILYVGDTCILRQRSGQFNAFTIIPFDEIRGDIYKKLSFLIVIAMVIVLFCIIILVIYSRGFKSIQKAYIKRIDEKQSQLEEGIWDNVLYKVFTGNKLSEKEYDTMMKMISYQNYVYQSILIIVNGFNQDEETVNDKYNELKRIISDSFENVNYNIVTLEKERVGIVLRFDRLKGDYIYSKVNYLHNEASRNGIEISIIVQSPADEYENFECNIFGLFQMSLYQFVNEPGEIIKADTIPKVNENAEYPKNIQGKIILAVKNGDEEEYEKSCEEFVEYIRANNFLMGRKWGSYLYSSVIDVFDPEEEEELLNIKNIWEIFSLIKEKYLKIGDKTDEFYLEVKSLIEENYTDSGYCIASVAEVMGISAVYAGRKFKKSFDKSFNTYLAEFRCAKACEYLTETNKKSAEIAELCGFANTAYYNHTFKKYMKIAPLQYREAYKK